MGGSKGKDFRSRILTIRGKLPGWADHNHMRIRGTEVLALFLLLVLWILPIRAAEEKFALCKGKAGPIQAGMTIDERFSRVGRNNTRLVDQHSEGYFSPVIVRFDAKPPHIRGRHRVRELASGRVCAWGDG